MNRGICNICTTDTVLYPMDCGGGHTYCLACIKSMQFSSSPGTHVSCPECRGRPSNKGYIKKLCETPDKVQSVDLDTLKRELVTGRDYLWIYEGRNNGWWFYDSDLQDILETAYKNEDITVEWVICGQEMVIDLEDLTQVNVDNDAIRAVNRVHKRNLGKFLIKGIAGMK